MDIWRCAEAGRGEYVKRWIANLKHRSRTLHVDAADISGWTPLLCASAKGRTDIVKMLLEAGASPNPTDPSTGSNALHFCAAGGHARTLRLLILAGGDVNGRNMSDVTPLAAAAKNDKPSCCRIILKHNENCVESLGNPSEYTFSPRVASLCEDAWQELKNKKFIAEAEAMKAALGMR